MANQQELSDYIKKVHIDLRVTARKVGPQAAWEEHLKKEDILKKYAEAMHDLATLHWDKNLRNDQKVNRINWVIEECGKYFSVKGRQETLEKEKRLAKRYFGDIQSGGDEDIADENKPLKLLDVGSCYNPFKGFEMFDVTAIDLAPATEDVFRCDFLQVNIGEFVIKNNTVMSLPNRYFDVVVLSLLLQYLPHPSLRYECCMKTYEVLRPGGALLIITPDSKHPSANSQIMKSWRMALASIGFLKGSYEKTEHLHCMLYSKCLDVRIPKHWLSLKRFDTKDPKSMIIVPQDNVQYKTENNEKLQPILYEQRCESDNKNIAENFSILAGDFLF